MSEQLAEDRIVVIREADLVTWLGAIKLAAYIAATSALSIGMGLSLITWHHAGPGIAMAAIGVILLGPLLIVRSEIRRLTRWMWRPPSGIAPVTDDPPFTVVH